MELNRRMHCVRGGETAGGTKTEASYYEATVDSLLEDADGVVGAPLFHDLLALFVRECKAGLCERDLGWQGELSAAPQTVKAAALRAVAYETTSVCATQ